MAVDVEQKCSTDDTATSGGDGDQAVTAEHDGTGVTSDSTDRTTAGQSDVAGSNLDKIATNTDEPAQEKQQQEEQGSDEMESGTDAAAEDPEITFKKQAQHGTEQADVDLKKEARDVNRNSEEMCSSAKTTCCSA